MQFGKLRLAKISNKELARRNILVRPPEPPLGILMKDPTNSIYIGKTAIFQIPFYWTFENVKAPHIVVVGMTGSGKSYFIKTFLLRAAFVWGTNSLIFDWAGEYKDWAREKGKVIALGKGSYLNLLDLGGMKPYDRIDQIMKTLLLVFGNDLDQFDERKRLIAGALVKAYQDAKFRLDSSEHKDELGKSLTPPTLKDVVRVLEDYQQMGNYPYPTELAASIDLLKKFTRSGQDYFAQPSSVSLDELVTSGIVDLDLSGLPSEEQRVLGALTILQFVKEKMRLIGITKQRGLKLLVVIDEAWKIAGDDNSDVVLIVREGRKYNFGVIVASQSPTDISPNIFSNAGTIFILNIFKPDALNYLQDALQFSNYIRDQIIQFPQGRAAVKMFLQEQTSKFSGKMFVVDKIEGEEVSKQYFITLDEVLTKKQKAEGMEPFTALSTDDLKRRLVQYGVSNDKVDAIIKKFEKQPGRRLDVISYVIMLEQFSLDRRSITEFLKDVGIDDITIINIFGKVDLKKAELRAA